MALSINPTHNSAQVKALNRGMIQTQYPVVVDTARWALKAQIDMLVISMRIKNP
jgi:hypothetical protein